MSKYVSDKFNETYNSTVGVQFMSKRIEIGSVIVKLQLWDTSGLERFREISKAHYKNAVAIITVFDLTSESSFNGLDKFVQEAKQVVPNAHCFLIGNKVDLTTQRVVSPELANEYAQKNGMIYQEVSAKSGEGIQSFFELLVIELLKMQEQKAEAQFESIKSNLS